jgi:hypothetical protein
MPDGEWFELQGVVARDSPGLGFGVRFMNLDEKQAHQIGSLLRKQNASPDESFDNSDYRESFIPLDPIDFNSRCLRS